MFETPRYIRTAAGPADIDAGYPPLADIDLPIIWSRVRHGWMTILFTVTAALVAAALFLVLAPREYTATTQILIDPTDLHAVANELTTPTQVSDTAQVQVESQVRVLTSDVVLRRVIKAENLDDDPEFVGQESLLRTLADDLLALFGISRNPAAADKSLTALNELRRRLQVRRAERTFVIDVSVTSRDPEKAARIANAIAQSYLAEQTQVRADAARQVSQSITARLNDLKDRVREAEERVEAFKARNNIVNSNGQLISEQQLNDLNNQLSVARARTLEARARLEQVQAVQKSKGEMGAFPEAVQSATITALRSQYAEVVRREAEQGTTLGPRHPAVIEIEAQAQRLRQNIAVEVDRIAISARTEYDSAKANENMLSQSLDALKHNTLATNEALVTLRELERNVQASRTVYEAFLVRARETGEQEQLDTKNIRVISRADLPLRRSSPPSSAIIGLAALFLGIAAGTGIVLMRGPTGDEVPLHRGGGPPRGGRRAATRPSRTRTASSATTIPVLATLPDVDVSFGLDEVEDPRSRFAREIHKVYDAVRETDRRSGGPSVLVIALDDEDDAATVALPLAAATAATQRVLLIDADPERRTLSAIDADQSEAGLVDVAAGRRDLADVVVHDRDTHINVVPFIAVSSSRTRSISDEDVKQAFDRTKRFDLVIVAATDDSDGPGTRFFAGLVDHIVVVTSAGEDAEAAVAEFAAQLGRDAGKIRGVVLTGAEDA
jgi:polysaccharide biosynthesis transport protein